VQALRSVYDALGRGAWAAARAECRDILARAQDVAAAHHALGLSLCGEGAFAEALPHFEAARALEPSSPRWARELGVVHAKLKRWPDAFAVLSEPLESLDADAIAVWLTAAVEVGRPAEALAALAARRPAPLPADAQLLCAYGIALTLARRHDEAASALHACLARDPDRGDAHEALSMVYEATHEPERSLHHARECVRLLPGSAHARIRLALACSERGLCDEGRRLRLEAEQLGLTQPDDRSVGLYIMLSDPKATAARLLAASRRVFRDLPDVPPLALPAQRGSRARNAKRLRIGYISGECRSTPAYYFFRPFLSRHDRSVVDVSLYITNPIRDEVTAEYMGWAERCRDCARLTDAALVETIRGDELDVLVDLTGHFIFNRLRAIAARAAPVQAAFPNFPGTTGCPGIDYFFTDKWTSPPGTQRAFSEQLYRLASGCLMYTPPEDGPPVGPLPMRRNGGPVFGVFQRLSKFNEGVWDAVAAVLSRAPSARLLIQNGDPELDRPESETSRRLYHELDARGINPARLTLRGPLPYRAHLSAVTQVDVALDTFPYAGQTTTCESLWMGVPVVTWPATTHASRVGAGLLSRIGRTEWIADSQDAYAAIAASLVSDVKALSRVRQGLRHDVIRGGLTDAERLARGLEEAYRSFRR
jgi:protein O-GlcNAc transferase